MLSIGQQIHKSCKSSKISLHLCCSWLLLTITTILLYCLVFRSSFMSLLNKMPFASMLYWHSNNSSINCLCKHIFICIYFLIFSRRNWVFHSRNLHWTDIWKKSTTRCIKSNIHSHLKGLSIEPVCISPWFTSQLTDSCLSLWCRPHNWLFSPRCVLVTTAHTGLTPRSSPAPGVIRKRAATLDDSADPPMARTLPVQTLLDLDKLY